MIRMQQKRPIAGANAAAERLKVPAEPFFWRPGALSLLVLWMSFIQASGSILASGRPVTLKTSNDAKKLQRTVVHSAPEIFSAHLTGAGHPESPDRVIHAHSILKKASDGASFFIEAPRKATPEEIALVHDSKLIRLIDQKARSCQSEEPVYLYSGNSDMKLCRGTDAAAKYAVGSVLKSVDMVLSSETVNAFNLVRPPGHHGLPDQAMGFCFVNNVAIGARYAKQKYPETIKRVLIVDWDLHHGNGTQEIFLKDDSVFYFSVHLKGIFPNRPEDEALNNNGTMNRLIDPRQYRKQQVFKAFEDLALRMETFKPQIIFISAGFDGHEKETIVPGGLGLSSEDYRTLTQKILEMAKTYSNNRVISVLEGGYHVDAVGDAVLSHVLALSQEP